MLSVTTGSYAFVRVGEQDNLDLVPNLHIPLDRVIATLPALPEDPRALFDEKSLLDRIFTGANAQESMDGPVAPRDDMNGPISQQLPSPVPSAATEGAGGQSGNKQWNVRNSVVYQDDTDSIAGTAPKVENKATGIGGTKDSAHNAQKIGSTPKLGYSSDNEITLDPIPTGGTRNFPSQTGRSKGEQKGKRPSKKEPVERHQPDDNDSDSDWQDSRDHRSAASNESRQTFPELDADAIRQQSARERNERYVRKSQKTAFRIGPPLVVGIIFLLFSAEVAAIYNWPQLAAYLKRATNHSTAVGVDSKAIDKRK